MSNCFRILREIAFLAWRNESSGWLDAMLVAKKYTFFLYVPNKPLILLQIVQNKSTFYVVFVK